MKLAITGQDTLAAATTECCRRHFDLVPIEKAEIVWICYDTPIVDDAPVPDKVLVWIASDLGRANKDALILVSSQMPVGTTAQLEAEFSDRTFAYSPENIRVATAIADFESQTRIVVGRRSPKHDALLRELFSPFTANIIFTDPESAELTKHATNCLLAICIAYINEVARISKVMGGNVDVITQALRMDRRFNANTPLKAGPPFGGGHLARDIHVMTELAKRHNLPTPLIAHIKESNES